MSIFFFFSKSNLLDSRGRVDEIQQRYYRYILAPLIKGLRDIAGFTSLPLLSRRNFLKYDSLNEGLNVQGGLSYPILSL